MIKASPSSTEAQAFFAWIRRDDRPQVEWLLKSYGENIVNNLNANSGRTGLYAAVETDNLGLTALLLSHGADPNITGRDGLSLLFIAMIYACNVPMVKLLLDHGVSVDSLTPLGITSLMHAAKTGKADVVVLLLDRGADQDVQDDEGKTAKDWAVEKGMTDVVNVLNNTPAMRQLRAVRRLKGVKFRLKRDMK